MRSDTGVGLQELYHSVVGSSHIVIYCGSGVIKDRIGGLSRDDLVTRVAQKTIWRFAEQHGIDDVSAVCTSLFTSKNYAPEVKATIATSFTKEERDVIESIGRTLYVDSWSEGGLLSELVKFVLELSINFKKPVSIVTTNYDTYIEDSIVKELYIRKRKETLFNPELKLIGYVYGGSETGVSCKVYDRIFGQGEKFSKIEIHHIYGRIEYDRKSCDQDSRDVNSRKDDKSVEFLSAGNLVFSEEHYEKSHKRTLKVLTGLFSQGTTIIVGSSLTDTPLVRSLLKIKSKSEEQHGKNGGKIVSSRRAVYAFMKCGIDGYEKFQLERAEALDIEPLFYEFHDEIPEVFSNLTALLVHRNKDDRYNVVLPYDQALRKWVERANHYDQMELKELVELGYEMSAKLARDIVIEKYARKGELLKIECWFLDLERDVSKKVLRVWTNSVGPTFATDLRRTEAVDSSNAEKVASVQAFCEGAPKIIPIDQLKLGLVKLKDDKNVSATRWKSFLSVPTVIHFEEYNVDVTIGVVTLASTYKLSEIKPENFFDDGEPLKAKLMFNEDESFLTFEGAERRKELVNYLKALGIYLADRIYFGNKEN